MEPILSRPTILTSAEISKLIGAQYMRRCLPLLVVLWIVVGAQWLLRGDVVSVVITVLAVAASLLPYGQAWLGMLRLKAKLATPHQYEITQHTLRRIFEDGEQSKYPWHLFERAKYERQYLLLFLDWTHYVIVPTRNLTEQDLGQLHQILLSHGLL